MKKIIIRTIVIIELIESVEVLQMRNTSLHSQLPFGFLSIYGLVLCSTYSRASVKIRFSDIRNWISIDLIWPRCCWRFFWWASICSMSSPNVVGKVCSNNFRRILKNVHVLISCSVSSAQSWYSRSVAHLSFSNQCFKCSANKKIIQQKQRLEIRTIKPESSAYRIAYRHSYWISARKPIIRAKCVWVMAALRPRYFWRDRFSPAIEYVPQSAHPMHSVPSELARCRTDYRSQRSY